MQKCTFSSVSKTIAENISNAHRLNQTEFMRAGLLVICEMTSIVLSFLGEIS